MSGTTNVETFSPDLIVEATSVCDRACAGCYAPNVVTRSSVETLLIKNPELFLTPEKLTAAINQALSPAPGRPITISFRGGEPTRNPFIAQLLEAAREKEASRKIYLETHGRWVNSTEPEEADFREALLQTIQTTRSIVKISFDQMHGLSCDELYRITAKLSGLEIQWCVAITEFTEEEFSATRAICNQIADDKIIFQRKTKTSHELTKPSIGVIKMDGTITSGLTTRFMAIEAGIPFSGRVTA